MVCPSLLALQSAVGDFAEFEVTERSFSFGMSAVAKLSSR